MPPTFVASTDARCLLAAVSYRLPVALNQIKRKCHLLSLAFGSDAAASCRKLGRHFSVCTSLRQEGVPGQTLLDGVLVLHAFCCMHQLALVVALLMKIIGALTPMFCACVLMQRGGNRKLVRTHVRNDVEANLEVVFVGDHDPDKQLFLEHLFNTLDYADEESKNNIWEGCSQQPHDANKQHELRLEARQRLAKALAASDIVDFQIVT